MLFIGCEFYASRTRDESHAISTRTHTQAARLYLADRPNHDAVVGTQRRDRIVPRPRRERPPRRHRPHSVTRTPSQWQNERDARPYTLSHDTIIMLFAEALLLQVVVHCSLLAAAAVAVANPGSNARIRFQGVVDEEDVGTKAQQHFHTTDGYSSVKSCCGRSTVASIAAEERNPREVNINSVWFYIIYIIIFINFFYIRTWLRAVGVGDSHLLY